jgi:hypothetical protein
VEKRYQVCEVIKPDKGNDAAFEGKTLKGEPHECQEHEIRLQGSLWCKPLRG